MNIVLLSTHWYLSPRQAGFHHLANAWHAQGHRITFATVGLSWISYARRDYRTKYKNLWQARNKMQKVCENLYSYVHFTHLHPHTTLIPALDDFFANSLDKYANYPLGELKNHIKNADIILYESSSALFLVEHCKEIAKNAKHIYRVSDDISILRSTPPRMIQKEQEVARLFDSISVPCAYLQEKFNTGNSVQLLRHGIDTASFDQIKTSPYAKNTKNAIYVGVFNFDAASVWLMAKQSPEVNFHIIGNVPMQEGLNNVFLYKEMPFKDTLPYVKFADIGLQTRKFEPAAKSFTDSLKVIQYRYCGLPIIAPDFLDLQRDGVFYYTPEDEKTCKDAIQNALKSGKDMQRADEVKTWDEVSKEMLKSST